MIAVYTGDGKGKTTAALGAAMRAVGRSKKVLMIQWIKGSWKSGEELVNLKGLGEFRLVKMGLGFVGILGDKLPKSAHKKAASAALNFFEKELGHGRYNFFILDEINVAVSLRLISVARVIKAVRRAKENQVVILTGRGASESIISIADLVTEMREVKHPFQSAALAKKSFEF